MSDIDKPIEEVERVCDEPGPYPDNDLVLFFLRVAPILAAEVKELRAQQSANMEKGAFRVTITPALMRRIEALGFTTGESNPVAWVVGEAERLRGALLDMEDEQECLTDEVKRLRDENEELRLTRAAMQAADATKP